MGLQARHDRLRREYRGLEDELEEAKRLKTWYERCLSELDHTTAPVPSELPQLEIAPQGQVELAPSTATSASPVVPIPAHTESLAKEPGLPDAASHTESLEPVTQLGLRQLVVAETEFGTEAGDAVQMVDVELSHPPSLQEEPSTASSELDSDDASYSKIDRNELDELEVREEEVEEGKGRLLVD